MIDHRREVGFTLVELLVVVAIVAMLISILLPALGDARRVVWQSICGTNQKNYTTAASLFTYDHDGWYAPAKDDGKHLKSEYDRDRFMWIYFLAPYLSLDRDQSLHTKWNKWDQGTNPLHCPAQPSDFNAFIGDYSAVTGKSWSYKGWVPIGIGYNTMTGRFYGNGQAYANSRLKHVSLVQRPSTTVMLGDSLNTHIGSFRRVELERELGGMNPRHFGKVNVSFFDGHVETRAIDSMDWDEHFFISAEGRATSHLIPGQ